MNERIRIIHNSMERSIEWLYYCTLGEGYIILKSAIGVAILAPSIHDLFSNTPFQGLRKLNNAIDYTL